MTMRAKITALEQQGDFVSVTFRSIDLGPEDSEEQCFASVCGPTGECAQITFNSKTHPEVLRYTIGQIHVLYSHSEDGSC